MSFEELLKLKENMGSKQYNHVVFGSNATKTSKKPSTFKRDNKNRPREMSSKKRVHLEQAISTGKTFKPRDPRFDSLCGEYDDKTFKSNYRFLKEVKKKELEELESQLPNEENPKRQEKIKYLIQRLVLLYFIVIL